MQGKKCTQYKLNFCFLQLFTVYVCGVLGSNHRAENIFSALQFKPMQGQANLCGWKLDSISCWGPINLRNNWPEKVTRKHLKISYLSLFFTSYKRSHQVKRKKSVWRCQLVKPMLLLSLIFMWHLFIQFWNLISSDIYFCPKTEITRIEKEGELKESLKIYLGNSAY